MSIMMLKRFISSVLIAASLKKLTIFSALPVIFFDSYLKHFLHMFHINCLKETQYKSDYYENKKYMRSIQHPILKMDNGMHLSPVEECIKNKPY